MLSISVFLEDIQMLFPVFLRITSILITMPVLGSKNIPAVFKAWLGFGLSILLFPLLNPGGIRGADMPLIFSIGAVSEIFLGISIGFSVRLLFSAIQMAGQLAGFQMGFAIANVFDPFSSQQISVIGQIYHIFAMLIFLVTGFHHAILLSIADSFEMIPPFAFRPSADFITFFICLSGKIFMIAFQIGAPLIVALLVSNIAMGLIARTVPQINVFFVAMPLNIAAGLLLLMVSFSLLTVALEELFSDFGVFVYALLKAG
ncbi:MAG: flagellar biosynthetic protein FliR [Desulfococcaceae bacterium]|jgi:flagellar biosynthetic protein FliR|nr:flagellar biosynthetic protein FliR [Desulfococcaceae bacterium]